MLAPDAVNKAVGPEAYREIEQLGLRVAQLERDVIRLPQAQVNATAAEIAALGFWTIQTGTAPEMAVWTAAATLGSTSIAKLVDADGDTVLDTLNIARVGFPAGLGAGEMLTLVDGGNTSGNDTYTIYGDGGFNGPTLLTLRSTGGPETLAYVSDIPSITNLVTTNTNQSGMSGNKVWTGTAEFDGAFTLGENAHLANHKGFDWTVAQQPRNSRVSMGIDTNGVFLDSDNNGVGDIEPIFYIGYNCAPGTQATKQVSNEYQAMFNFSMGFSDPSGHSVGDNYRQVEWNYDVATRGNIGLRAFQVIVNDVVSEAPFASLTFKSHPGFTAFQVTDTSGIFALPVNVTPTVTGSFSSSLTALALTATFNNTNDQSSGALYASTSIATFNGGASSGSPGLAGHYATVDWSGSAASRKVHGYLTAGIFSASISQTGATPAPDAGMKLQGIQVGWTIPGQNVSWPAAYGIRVVSPDALGSGSSLGEGYGIHMADQKGIGSFPQAAVWIDAQTGGSSGTKGNLRMYGGDWDDGHIQLGSSPTAHFWLDASSSKLRLGSGTSAGIGIHDDGVMLVSGTRFMWGSAATTATASRTAAIYEAAGGIVFESGTTNVLAMALHTVTVQPNVMWQMAAATASRPSLNIPPGTAPTSPGEGDEWYDSTQTTVILSQGLTPINAARDGTLYVATATATVTNTTTETTLIGSGVGTVTLPASSFMRAGKTLCIKASGVLSTDASAHTLRFKIKKGSTVILDTGASTPPNSLSGRVWRLYAEITGRSTTSVIANGFIEFADATNSATSKPVAWEMNNGTTAVTIGTTSEAIDLTMTIGTGASASDSVSCTDFSMSVRM